MYYVIQFGESSPELIRAVAGDVDCSSEALWFGQTSPSPYLPFLREHYNQISSPFKNRLLQHFAHKWRSVRGDLRTNCGLFPLSSHFTINSSRDESGSEVTHGLSMESWMQTRASPYIYQVDTRVSSKATGAQRNDGTSPRSYGSWTSEVEPTLKSLGFLIFLVHCIA